MADFQPGDVFAGHHIEGVAGRGGMGVVYRALQLDLERPVALKLIAPALAEDEAFRDRFVRESRAAASIDHPNVIPIYYTGEHEGLLYIAMRYVQGSDLRTLVRAEGRLAPDRAARLVAQVGAALDAAHARGLVHRDVKPANVLLGGEDHAYLTDFGLTKRLHSAGAASTHAGGWVGTLGYVAPEQIRGGRVDARADVYALGCVLFHALTGGPPYQRDRDEATLWAHLNEPPPSVSSVPDVPRGFEDVLRRALAKDPADRHPSAGDLGRAALAAAGAAAPARAERVVAVGAAAPTGDEETVASADESPTRMATRRAHDSSGAEPDAARRGSRVAWLLALVPVLALAAVGLLLLRDGGGGEPDDGAAPGGASAAEGQDGAPAPAGRVVRTVPVGGRPNDVVVAGGSVWVLRGGNERLAILDPSTGRRRPERPRIGVLPAAATAAFGKLWVARQLQPALVAVGLGSRERTEPEALLPPGLGPVVAVAASENALFAGIRSRPGLLVRVDPRTREVTKRVELPRGVQDLAVGEGAVWVTARSEDVVTRVAVRTGEMRDFNVGRDPGAVAVGADAVWVANRGEDTVTRIDTGSFNTSTHPVGRSPAGVAVGGGAVWVANRIDSTLTRLDPATGRRAGRSVEVPSNPFAVDVRSRQVWVTSLGRSSVTRVDFERASR